MEVPKKAMTLKQILSVISVLGIMIVSGAAIALPQILQNQKNLSAGRSRAAELNPTVGSCQATFSLLTPTPTPLPTDTPTPPPGITITQPPESPTPTDTPTPTNTPIPTPTPILSFYPTRTIGYWQTHTQTTSLIFSLILNGQMQIGFAPHKGIITNTQLPGQSQLFGAFYASIPKMSNGTSRTSVDQARMQLLQQLVGAKLNCAAFDCSSTTVALIANADSAYAYGTDSQILNYSSQLDTYNNSGDKLGSTSGAGATPSASKALADIVFWDAP